MTKTVAAVHSQCRMWVNNGPYGLKRLFRSAPINGHRRVGPAGLKRAKPRQGRAQRAQRKSFPEAASQNFNLMIARSGGYQCWPRLSTIRHEAKTHKAEDHHCPCGWFGDGGYIECGIDVQAYRRASIVKYRGARKSVIGDGRRAIFQGHSGVENKVQSVGRVSKDYFEPVDASVMNNRLSNHLCETSEVTCQKGWIPYESGGRVESERSRKVLYVVVGKKHECTTTRIIENSSRGRSGWRRRYAQEKRRQDRQTKPSHHFAF
jgi:hypothetical protein